MDIKALRGTKDILPPETEIWQFIESKARDLCSLYGYQEIRTPLLEEMRLFTRSIGASSDIVRKEMYAFRDRKKRLLCLRPEATASVVRAYLEHHLDKHLSLAKLYYIGAMFRAERPQAGRLRQFHHIGAEAIGSASPYLDAEIILLAINIIRALGIEGWKLEYNSLGCQKDRAKYKSELKRSLKNKLKSLCSDCRDRYKLNILRIFDCKNPECRKIIRELPGLDASLCATCGEHYGFVERTLENSLREVNILPSDVLVRSPHLVRGLDYYTGTCFEITHDDLGAQNALGAGGRYDNLLSDLGGPQKPAVGFALGIERLIAVLDSKKEGLTKQTQPRLFIAAIGPEAKHEAFRLLCSLRKQNLPCDIDYTDKSLKGQMRQADRLKAKFVAILGEVELKKQTVILRDMRNQQQKEIKISQLPEELK
ncbi:MAG: histidine--tRNA ligase [Candidatus Omnitrophica bacterium]|nr:histidine--tRNA ligase [Candidatus Omnitrophota bacterium]